MNIQVIWENGALQPIQPLRLRHPMVTIQVPDEESATASALNSLPSEVLTIAAEMRKRLDAIRHATLPPDHQLSAISEKTIERMAAFEVRAEYRREQECPV